MECKYAKIFFSLLVDIYNFFSNFKGLEIVGIIVIYNYQNQINTWKNCFHLEHDVYSNGN